MEEKQPGFICFSIWHFLLPFAIYITSSLRLPYPPPPFFPSRFVNWICTCSIPPLTYAFFFNPPTPLFATFLPPSLCLGRFSPLKQMYFPFAPPPPLYILYLIYSYKFKEDYTSQVMESHYPAILIVDPFLLTCHLLWVLDPKTTISQPISVIQTNTFFWKYQHSPSPSILKVKSPCSLPPPTPFSFIFPLLPHIYPPPYPTLPQSICCAYKNRNHCISTYLHHEQLLTFIIFEEVLLIFTLCYKEWRRYFKYILFISKKRGEERERDVNN